MSRVLSEEYLGLPIPTEDELDTLRVVLFADDEDEDAGPEVIYDLVEEKRPYIGDALNTDKSIFADRNRTMTEEDIDETCAGVEEGYEFVVGCLTYVRFMRSDYRTPRRFVEGLPNDSLLLPLSNYEQYQRYIDCLCDRALIDKGEGSTPRPDVVNSSSLAQWLTTRYLSEAVGLNVLIGGHLDRITPAQEVGTSETPNLFIAGFCRGLNNAVEMYVQSYEYDILDAHDWVPPPDIVFP